MKLGFLINSYGQGGAQRVISLVSSRLDDIPQVLVQYGGELAYFYPGKVIDLDGRDGVLRKTRFGRALNRLDSLRKVLKDEDISVLVSFLVRTNVLAALAKRLGLFHGVLILNEVSVPSCHLKYSALHRWLIKKTYKWADKIVVPSSGILEDLVTNSGLRRELIKVIPNPIDSNAIERSAQEECGSDLVRSGAFTLIAAGRLTAQKGFDLLIRALPEVHKSIDVRLVIIGDGEERGEIVRLARELGVDHLVHLTGWMDNPFSIMAKGDIFVLSSRHEGFGNVIVEAMCCGLPVISYDCPSGPREILGNCAYGVLVENGDVAGLSAAIVKMARDDEYRARYRQKALERAKDYEIEHVVSMWKAELNDV